MNGNKNRDSLRSVYVARVVVFWYAFCCTYSDLLVFTPSARRHMLCVAPPPPLHPHKEDVQNWPPHKCVVAVDLVQIVAVDSSLQWWLLKSHRRTSWHDWAEVKVYRKTNAPAALQTVINCPMIQHALMSYSIIPRYTPSPYK